MGFSDVSYHSMSEKHTVEVGDFHATFKNVLLPFGLRVHEVTIDAKDASVEHDPFSISVPVPGEIVVTVTEENLREFLEAEAPGGLSDFEIKLTEGKVFVEANAKVIVKVRAKAECSFEIVDGTKLFVRLDDVDVMGVGAHRLVEKQLGKVNPILDAADLPLAVTLTSVTIAEGVMLLRGTAEM